MTVVLALMVIYIHVASRAVGGYDKASFVYGFVFITQKLCAFAVYGFIFLSPAKYFAAPRADSFRYGSFILKRVRKIALPYILWVFIYYIFFIWQGYFHFSVPELIKYLLTGELVAHLYFVVIIIQFYLLMPLWRWLAGLKTAPLAAITAVSFVITVISQVCFPGFAYSDRIFTSYLFFWLLGILCGSRYEAFVSFIKRRRFLLIIGSVIVAAHIILSYLSSRGSIRYPHGNVWQLVCVTALIMLAFYFCVSIKPEKIPFWGLLQRISDSSFYIYLSHVLLIFIIDKYTPGFTITQNLSLRLILTFTVPTALSISYTALKKKIQGRIQRA